MSTNALSEEEEDAIMREWRFIIASIDGGSDDAGEIG